MQIWLESDRRGIVVLIGENGRTRIKSSRCRVPIPKPAMCYFLNHTDFIFQNQSRIKAFRMADQLRLIGGGGRVVEGNFQLHSLSSARQ